MSSPFRTDDPFGAAFDPEVRQLQKWLGLTFLVSLGVCFCGVNVLLPQILDHLDDNPFTALLLGVCIAEVNLIAVWGVMAPGRWLLRLPWAFALLTIMWYGLVVGNLWENPSFQMEEAIHVGVCLLMGFPCAMLPLVFINAIFGWKLERPQDQQVREQMSIRLLLIAMTLLGALLALGRLILPDTGFRFSAMDHQIFLLLGVIILFNLIQTTPAIWVSFLPAHMAVGFGFGMLAATVVLSILEILFVSMFLGMPPDFLEILIAFTAINMGQVATVMLVLVSLRLLGFQLVRRYDANPFSKPQGTSPFAAPAKPETKAEKQWEMLEANVVHLFEGIDTDSGTNNETSEG